MHGSGPLVFFAIVVVVFLFVDWYAFQGLNILTQKFATIGFRRLIHWVYWTVNVALLFTVITGFVTANRTHTVSPWQSIVFNTLITFFVTKLVFVAVLLSEDVGRFGFGIYSYSKGKFGSSEMSGEFFSDRRLFMTQIALGLSAIPFFSFIYGVTKGKYNFIIRNHTLTFKDLPTSFDGFRIVQISDIHAGSFDSVEDVQRGVDMVNQVKADLFVFTGDLVNNLASEIEPWLSIFSSIKAPFGQFSILGNHDYGSYISWASPEAKEENLQKVVEHHSALGYRLLMDESVRIEKDGQAISLLGVQNWGHDFGKKGDLKKALNGVDENDFKILLTHDPSHWEGEVLGEQKHVHLTLSGHTHGMQLGIELPGIKWSPVQYRYPQWAGIYNVGEKFLHVNRGFGFIGFHGRVGIMPEITVVELKRG